MHEARCRRLSLHFSFPFSYPSITRPLRPVGCLASTWYLAKSHRLLLPTFMFCYVSRRIEGSWLQFWFAILAKLARMPYSLPMPANRWCRFHWRKMTESKSSANTFSQHENKFKTVKRQKYFKWSSYIVYEKLASTKTACGSTYTFVMISSKPLNPCSILESQQ